MNDPLDALLGRRLKLARLERGISVDVLASKMDVERSELEAYEAGKKRVSSAGLVRACDALNVDPLFFFKSEAGPEPSSD